MRWGVVWRGKKFCEAVLKFREEPTANLVISTCNSAFASGHLGGPAESTVYFTSRSLPIRILTKEY